MTKRIKAIWIFVKIVAIDLSIFVSLETRPQLEYNSTAIPTTTD